MIYKDFRSKVVAPHQFPPHAKNGWHENDPIPSAMLMNFPG